MTTLTLPHMSEGLMRSVSARPRPLFLAALAFILMGALIVGTSNTAYGLVLGGTSGWLLWFSGVSILAIWLALLLGGQPSRGLLIAGVVAAVSGVFLFYNPRAGVLAITILAISSLVMDGGIQLALALRLRPAGVWRWLFASALASVVAAAALSGGSRLDPAAAGGALTGVALISSGLALLLLSRTASRRSLESEPD